MALRGGAGGGEGGTPKLDSPNVFKSCAKGRQHTTYLFNTSVDMNQTMEYLLLDFQSLLLMKFGPER